VGAPPGYIGHDEGGYLTDQVRRRPWSVVLFDEVEKAHEDVLNLLLQILEDGVLTDSQSRRTDFCNTVIVMTSNVGAKTITSGVRPLGFDSQTDTAQRRQEALQAHVLEQARQAFRPEFLNRVDEIVVFRPLTEQELCAIAQGLLDAIAQRLGEKGITLTVVPQAVEALARMGYDPAYGARPLRRCLRQQVEDALAELLLQGKLQPGDRVSLILRDGVVGVEKVDEVIAG
jgi:ATP-dependent Clp protease ATP-binding subunit ClpC